MAVQSSRTSVPDIRITRSVTGSGTAKVKFASDESETVGTEMLVTLTRHAELGAPSTVQISLPSSGVLGKSCSHVPPGKLRFSSILTFPVIPEDDQRIVCELPMYQTSPPLGETTAISGFGATADTVIFNV